MPDPEFLARLRAYRRGTEPSDGEDQPEPITLAELRVFVDGLDVTAGHNREMRSAARTLLARNSQTDGPSPYEEDELEVEVAIFGFLYCSKYLCAALDLDLDDLVAQATACYSITKDMPKDVIQGHLDESGDTAERPEWPASRTTTRSGRPNDNPSTRSDMPDLRLVSQSQPEVDDSIAQIRASLPTDPMVTDLVAFAEGLDATADPNVKRIQLAARALVAFQRLSDPESWERSEAPDALTDVLAHLMHLSPIIGGDFDALLADARSHFADESVNPWL